MTMTTAWTCRGRTCMVGQSRTMSMVFWKIIIDLVDFDRFWKILVKSILSLHFLIFLNCFISLCDTLRTYTTPIEPRWENWMGTFHLCRHRDCHRNLWCKVAFPRPVHRLSDHQPSLPVACWTYCVLHSTAPWLLKQLYIFIFCYFFSFFNLYSFLFDFCRHNNDHQALMCIAKNVWTPVIYDGIRPISPSIMDAAASACVALGDVVSKYSAVQILRYT